MSYGSKDLYGHMCYGEMRTVLFRLALLLKPAIYLQATKEGIPCKRLPRCLKIVENYSQFSGCRLPLGR